MSDQNMEEIPVITDAPSDESNDLKDKFNQTNIHKKVQGKEENILDEILNDGETEKTILYCLKNFVLKQTSSYEGLYKIPDFNMEKILENFRK